MRRKEEALPGGSREALAVYRTLDGVGRELGGEELSHTHGATLYRHGLLGHREGLARLDVHVAVGAVQLAREELDDRRLAGIMIE